MRVEPVAGARRLGGRDRGEDIGRRLLEGGDHAFQAIVRRSRLGALPAVDGARKLFGMPGAEHVEPCQSADQMLAADRAGRVGVGFVLAAARPHHRAAAEGRSKNLGDSGPGTVEYAAVLVDLLGVREPAQVRPVEPVTEFVRGGGRNGRARER